VQETAFIAPTPATSATSVVPMGEYDDDEEGGSRTGMVIFLGVLLVALIGAAAYFLPKLMENKVEQVEVPNVVNMKKTEAEKKLDDLGLVVKEEFRNDETIAKNTVMDQDPNAYQYVDPGSSVTLTISSGVPVVQLPDVVGDNVKDAKAQLDALGFNVKVKKVESDEPKGDVVEMSPEGNTPQQKGSDVTLSYSAGPLHVPNVVGLTEEEAKAKLADAGFTDVKVLHSDDTDQPAGTVIDQTPEKGDTWPQDQPVTIFVSSLQPTPTETPTDTTSPTPTDTGSPTIFPTPTGSP
jgi:beta-lactam-binding protein with PASTA domain